MPPETQPARAIASESPGMLPERSGALHALLDCTLEMLQQAKLEQWRDAMQTGAQRQRLIEGFFEKPVAAGEANKVAIVLRKILQINEEIETLAINSRGGVSKSIGSIKQGRRAMLAYAENMGTTGISGLE